jgi:hypothetical protein
MAMAQALSWQIAEKQQQPSMPLAPGMLSPGGGSFQDLFKDFLGTAAPTAAPPVHALVPPAQDANVLGQAQQLLKLACAPSGPAATLPLIPPVSMPAAPVADDAARKKRQLDAEAPPPAAKRAKPDTPSAGSDSESQDTMSQGSDVEEAKGVEREGGKEEKKEDLKYMEYECGYCSSFKVSTSSGSDGRVRIRCECGGKHRDGKPRMHAKWVARPGCGGTQEHLKSRMRAQWRQTGPQPMYSMPSAEQMMMLAQLGVPMHLQQLLPMLMGQMGQAPQPQAAMPFHYAMPTAQ